MKASSNSFGSTSQSLTGRVIHDKKGMHATIKAVQAQGEGTSLLLLLGEDGNEYLLPPELIERKGDTYYASVAFAECRQAGNDNALHGLRPESESVHSIPVWEEFVNVEKRMVDSGRGIRIEKKVREREEHVAVSLLEEEIHVERRPINKILASHEIPVPRQEDDTYIVPVLKEVLVVEKKICLEEEVRITRKKRQVDASQSIPLRSEDVSIHRFDEGKN